MSIDRNSVNLTELGDAFVSNAKIVRNKSNRAPYLKPGGKGKKPSIQGKQTKTSGKFGGRGMK